MSEVNQAFLRAYVKNRAAANLRDEANSVQRRIDPPAGQVSPVQPQVAKAPSAASAPASAATKPAAAPPMATTQVQVGVWSALGVERGMKSVPISQPAPAAVRNATTAVPMEATLPRPKQSIATPVARPATQPVAPPVAQPISPPVAMADSDVSPSLETLTQAWTKKRAPALKDLKPRSPAPQVPMGTSVTEERSPRSPQSPRSEVRVRVDVPYPTVPVPTPPQNPTQYPTQKRADPPASQTVTGPHTGLGSQRIVDRQRLQELPLPVAFAPSWEVDTFFWPEVVTRLEQADANAFRQIANHIHNANHSGLQVLAVTSGERGVGRSTVAMHMARAAASTGLKVALVDADTANPSLVDQLRLDIQHGWQDCLFEAVPLEEVAVHSISDRVTLFPLTGVVSQQQVHANLHRMSKLIRRITTAFDFVILDSCRLNLDQRDLIGVSNESVVDAAVVVVDTELSIKEKIDSAIGILQSMGLTSIGLIENFRS